MCFTLCMFFFFNDTATTEIYTLSLHDALPICGRRGRCCRGRESRLRRGCRPSRPCGSPTTDRKSTRLNSSHSSISYAVFCLKKKTKNTKHIYNDCENRSLICSSPHSHL